MNKSILRKAMSLAVFGLLLVAGLNADAPVLAQSQSTSPRVTVEPDQVLIASQSDTHQFRVEVFNPGGEMVFDSGFVIGQPVSWNMKDQQGQRVADGVYVVVLSMTNAKGKVRKMIEQVIVWHKSTEQSTKSQSAIQERSADTPTPSAIQDSSAGTPGRIAKWTAADALGDSVITEDTSKIGIASITPTATLHVDAAQPRVSLANGTDAVTLLQTSGGKGGDANGATIGGKGADISLLAGNGGDAPTGTSGNGGNVTIQAGSSGSGATTGQSGRVLIAPFLGKVGIGTVNPDEKLTVEGNIQITGGGNGLKFADNTLQTTAGLTGVTHNMTLSGDGTGGLPLTVADQGIDTVQLKDGGVVSSKIAAGQIVRSLNSLKDDVTLAAGDNITITPGGNMLTIAATSAGLGSVSHNATLNGDGTGGDPLRVSVPLNLSGSEAGAILSVANAGSGPAITAVGVINTATHYSIGGSRALGVAGTNNVFAGVGAGANNSGVGNSFVGSAAGQSNTIGNLNSFFGQTAGVNNTTGNQNTFVGNSAGFANTSGSQNSFFGTGTGAFNTSGGGNSSFGFFAGRKNTTGGVNSFFGFEAGRENTAGNNNSFFGSYAGQLNTTGTSNSFFGSFTGQSTTTGTSNSFFGHQAGSANIAGSGNSFFGRNAGANNTSSNNAFFGIEAGLANTTGFDNSFFGREAGRNNVTGQSNSFFGSQAGHDNTGDQNSFFGRSAGTNNMSASNNSFFGFNAGRDTTSGLSNSFFGASAGRDNTTGGENAFFGRGAGLSNTSGIQNAFVGRGAGSSNTTGDHNSFFGWAAGAANTTGNHNTFIGALADGEAGLSNATAIGYKAMVTQNNTVVLGSINGVNGASSNTSVGIGTTAPSQRLHVHNGSVRISAPPGNLPPNQTPFNTLINFGSLILERAGGGIVFKDIQTSACYFMYVSNGALQLGPLQACP